MKDQDQTSRSMVDRSSRVEQIPCRLHSSRQRVCGGTTTRPLRQAPTRSVVLRPATGRVRQSPAEYAHRETGWSGSSKRTSIVFDRRVGVLVRKQLSIHTTLAKWSEKEVLAALEFRAPRVKRLILLVGGCESQRLHVANLITTCHSVHTFSSSFSFSPLLFSGNLS